MNKEQGGTNLHIRKFVSPCRSPKLKRKYSISTVKPIRCTNVSNLFYFGMTLYMFRVVFPSIIRNSDCTYSNRHVSNRYCCLLASGYPLLTSGYPLASRQQYLFDKCLLYVQSSTPDDGRKDRPKHVECHSKIK